VARTKHGRAVCDVEEAGIDLLGRNQVVDHSTPAVLPVVVIDSGDGSTNQSPCLDMSLTL
jgi:hypothetical protein